MDNPAKNVSLLEDWAATDFLLAFGQDRPARLRPGVFLIGYTDGRPHKTMLVRSLRYERGATVAETCDAVYRLGTPHPRYRRWLETAPGTQELL